MSQRITNSVSLSLLLIAISFPSFAQTYWQQSAKYEMDIELKAKKNCMEGEQTITYVNNSPDVIDKVFYHLYFNAFQPGSMMDMRSMTIEDPDPRVTDRISRLDKKEIGYHKIEELKQDGKDLAFEVVGTILEAKLNTPLMPGASTKLYMEFESQVPQQIRRSGKDNKEGISYTMTQWYPKLCEYDEDGWHPNSYVGREFYGIWSDWDVDITIDGEYIIGGTGEQSNVAATTDRKKRKHTWNFKAKNVHDFAWAADPDYKHTSFRREDGTMLNFYYQPGENTDEYWTMLPKVMDEAFNYINAHCGTYPYPQYSFIQGGDGGMEYPMATMITGERSFPSLVGVSVHELVHSWYQMMLGTNEALYPWMDEGFTTYYTAETMNHLKRKGLIPGAKPRDNCHNSAQVGYRNFSQSGVEEPLITHADYYKRNQAYGIASYTKGHVFLDQLSYIVGKEAFDKIMLDYFDQWKFKHPDVKDFIRVAEKRSGMVLDWYQEHFVNTTNQIDYGIDTVLALKKGQSAIILSKIGDMPMPIDVYVAFNDGTTTCYNIPLRLMRGNKPSEGLADKYIVAEDWPWTHPRYELVIDRKENEILSITIDRSGRLADVNPSNNDYPIME